MENSISARQLSRQRASSRRLGRHPYGRGLVHALQDVGAYGRLVHLQPMKWVDDWPVIGVDKDGDGCGEPVLTYKSLM